MNENFEEIRKDLINAFVNQPDVYCCMTDVLRSVSWLKKCVFCPHRNDCTPELMRENHCPSAQRMHEIDCIVRYFFNVRKLLKKYEQAKSLKERK